MQFGRGPFGELTPLALDALAEVVELGRLAQQPVVELVALALQGVERRRRGLAVGQGWRHG